MRRHADEPGTERARLPNGLRGFHPRFFGKLIFGEHYSVSLALAAADCHGHVAQLRSERTFDRGKEIIEVAVQNDPVAHCPSPFEHLFKYIISPFMVLVKSNILH